MYYLILLFCVICFFTVLAWRDPAGALGFPRMATRSGAGGSPVVPAATAPGSVFARLLKGEWKEDKPCLTPIDCVRNVRCDGHCGCR